MSDTIIPTLGSTDWPIPPAFTEATPADIMVAARKIGDWVDARDRVIGYQARFDNHYGQPHPPRHHLAITHAAYLEQRMLWREALRVRDLLETPAWMGGWLRNV